MSQKFTNNIDEKVIKDFGDEWSNFDQSVIKDKDLINVFNQYFGIFPKNFLNKNMEGFDMGCGSGRWSKIVAPLIRISLIFILRKAFLR